MDDCTLTLCGRVALTREGDASPTRTLGAKALALLAYLALEPRAHSRDELTALLWGEFDDRKAHASLRQALRQLRLVLGDRVRADRSFVELTGPLSCDVLEFVRHADSDPAAAVRIDVPHFLDGLPVRHCDGFEEWAGDMRATLRRRYARALAALGRDALARCDWRAAAEAAERWNAVEPLAEPMVHLAMEAHYLSGDRTGALGCFASYRDRLLAHSGREPGSSLQQLVEKVERSLDSRQRATPASAAASPAPMLDGSLVGRAAEWQRLRAAWTGTSAGHPAVVLVEGEAGTGKSRLTGDFARWVSSSGGTVLHARASEAGIRIPLTLIVELLQPVVDAPGIAGADPQWISEVARLIPALARRFPGVSTGHLATPIDRWRLFEGVSQILIAAAEESPLGIFVDDLQWCDADSCALLQFLVQRLDEAAVLWCATLTLGVAERDDSTVRLERALRAEGTVLVLEPLREEHVHALVQELGRLRDPPSAARFAHRLHAATAGNPFYVTELLKTMFADSWLRADPVSGEWCGPSGWTEAAPLPARPRVHAATAQRIGGLPDDLREMLITLAVAGCACPTALLSHVHGISRLRAAAMADALVERHLTVEAGGSYRCAQPMVAHVVRGELTTARRQEVHRAIAFALAQLGEADMPAPEDVARHAEQAGEHRLAHQHALAASAAAERRREYDDALDWLRLAARAARTPEETREAERATRALMRSAGWNVVSSDEVAASSAMLPARTDEVLQRSQ